MPQSLVQNYLHVVFGTKHRNPFLKDKDIRSRVHAYLAGTCKNLECPPLIVGGVEDHVHILTMCSKNITVFELVRSLKIESSKWIKTLDHGLSGFRWQGGYGAFSVSPLHVKTVKSYIERQEEHHRKKSFRVEFLKLCYEYEVEVDERYVWD